MSARRRGNACAANDMVTSRLGWLVWGPPGALFLVGIAWDAARAWLWIPALIVAGGACIANASRCGRLHCFVTGPLFLLGALATVASATGIMAIDWRWILGMVIGGTAIGYGLEWLRGKYVGGGTASEGSIP
jgi:hypothetical protein